MVITYFDKPKQFSDLKIICTVDNKTLYFSKYSLCLVSKYFEAMLTRWSDGDTITLNKSSEVMKIVLAYVYEDSRHLTKDTVKDVLDASREFLMDNLTKCCLAFMEDCADEDIIYAIINFMGDIEIYIQSLFNEKYNLHYDVLRSNMRDKLDIFDIGRVFKSPDSLFAFYNKYTGTNKSEFTLIYLSLILDKSSKSKVPFPSIKTYKDCGYSCYNDIYDMILSIKNIYPKEYYQYLGLLAENIYKEA